MVLKTVENRRQSIVDKSDNSENNQHRVKRAKIDKMCLLMTDLNEYCLESIFSLISLKDLANIAVTNSAFSASSIYVFRKLHINTPIIFDPCISNGKKFNNFLNLLEGFGEHIRKLSITFYQEKRHMNRNQRIIQKINEKCYKSVIELNLTNVRKDMVFVKPFVHLEKFILSDSFFNESLAQSIAKSPAALYLEFYTVENLFNSSFVNAEIRSMRHFGNFNQIIADSEFENISNFRNFIFTNQQVISLALGHKELETMFRSKEMQQEFFNIIHEGKVTYEEQKEFIDYLLPFERIYLGNLRHLRLSLGYTTEFLKCLRQNNLQIKELPIRHLELYVSNLNMETSDLILNFQSMTKLTLYICKKFSGDDLQNFIVAVLNTRRLQELELFLLYNAETDIKILPQLMQIAMRSNNVLKKITVGLKIERPSSCVYTECQYEERTTNQYKSSIQKAGIDNPFWRNIHYQRRMADVPRENSRKHTFLCCIFNREYMISDASIKL